VDCSGLKYLNLGCNGGRHSRGINWVRDNAITTLADYPYVAVKE
jgi:hypothetical protein